jgi:hypothetical protein
MGYGLLLCKRAEGWAKSTCARESGRPFGYRPLVCLSHLDILAGAVPKLLHPPVLDAKYSSWRSSDGGIERAKLQQGGGAAE